MIDYSRGAHSQDVELGKGSRTLDSMNTASIMVKFIPITKYSLGKNRIKSPSDVPSIIMTDQRC